MKIINNIKQKLEVLKKYILNNVIYMEKDSGIVCQDTNNGIINSVGIYPAHIDLGMDNPLEFPELNIIKTTARTDSNSMFKNKVLTLDTDDEPTPGSKKIITSGTLYNILLNIQEQIDDIKNK